MDTVKIKCMDEYSGRNCNLHYARYVPRENSTIRILNAEDGISCCLGHNILLGFGDQELYELKTLYAFTQKRGKNKKSLPRDDIHYSPSSLIPGKSGLFLEKLI